MYQFRRLTITGVCLLTAFLMFVAPSTAKKRARPPVAASSAASSEYTLRIVFDGLAAVWAPNADPNPGEVLFIMGPLHPDQLIIGSKMPTHQTHLLVQSIPDSSGNDKITTSGKRKLSQPMAFGHGNISLPGLWRQAILNGEDLTVNVADASVPLQVGDLSTVLNLPRELGKIPRGTVKDKLIQKCLTDATVTCADLKSQLSARVTLRAGTVSASDLLLDSQKKVIEFALGTTKAPPSAGLPMTKSVSVELKVRNAVEFSSNSLVDGKAKDSVSVQGLPGQTIEVHIASHPTCETIAACQLAGRTDGDFMFLY
ncbi:MAG TPA: hypothetical protein VGG20_21670, partial [Thermoanaerobaculia bacterium]